ncbi:MAG: hypothetical protein AB7R55_19190 [Gemmatimonadales bacterium]
MTLVAVAALAAANWLLSPTQALRWLRAGLMLPTLWLGMALWHRATRASLRRRGIDDDAGTAGYFGSAATLLVLAVGSWQIVALGLELHGAIGGQPGDLEMKRRALGLATSGVFVVVGNALPKILTPLSLLPRAHAALVTVARRFVGMTLVLIGLATAVAFLTAEVALATTALRWAAIVALVSIVGAIVWMNLAAAGQPE